MEILKASPFLTLHRLPATLEKPTFHHIPSSRRITTAASLPEPNQKPSFKSSAAISPAAPTVEDAPPSDVILEAEKKEEKFDWYSNWYPVMPVCDLDKRRPHGKKVIGIDIVVWWDKNENTWQVFEDSCPHRLAPLSEGRIDQWGRLQCVYHGWCFGGAGDCKLIPQALRDGPPVEKSKKACVAVYPSCVQNGIVWFWPNSDPQYKDIFSRKRPPYIPELDDPSYTNFLTSRDLDYGHIVFLLPDTQAAKAMGNCCSDEAGRQSAVGGTNSNLAANPQNEAVDAFLKSRGYKGLFSQIELSLSAADLRDRDVLSKSDPLVVLYIKGSDGSLQELGRTEVVLNSLSPKWIRKFTVTYQFEMVQNLVFRVYDVDTQFQGIDVKALKLEEQQVLGEASCTLSEIATKLYRTLTLDLAREEVSAPAHTRKCGKLTIYAEESVASKTVTELILRCSDLESKDLFSKSDPFLVISKATENGILVPICKTEVLKNDHDPEWKQILLSIQQVGSKDSPLVIECFNFNSNGKHDLLGKTQKSLAELEKLHSAGTGENLFIPVSVQNHQNKVLQSRLLVEKYSEKIQHTFLDYLAGGYELNFMVAIDFTASNGNPRLPDSLHYIDPSGRPNAYQRAIMEVGGILQFYDSDRRFPSWGFGARPIDGPVSHCFNLNGSSNYCEVEGIHGIMTAYTSALFNVSLAGPTLFGHVVTQAAQIASGSVARDERKYFVLLIITDGVITDLQETKDAFVMASDLPLSILIVGVGADFKEMEILDADKGERLESSSGRVASRDIVQFVPFRYVQNGEFSVVQSLLAELPTQFLSYVRARGIGPTTQSNQQV